MSEVGDDAPRLLLLAPNWLGDVVMASPLLSLLAGAVDDRGRVATVVLAVRRRWAPLFEDDPRVARILPVERTGHHRGLGGLWKLGRDLRRVGADGVVLGPPSLRAAAVAALAGLPVRVGYRSDGRSALLTHGRRVPVRGAQHHGDELLALGRDLLAAVGLRSVTGPGDPGRPGLPGCANVLPIRGGDEGPVWVFAPGTTYGEAKVWPVAPATAFVDAAVAREGVRVVLLGDAAAGGFAREMAAASGVAWRKELPGGPGVVDLTGTTSLLDAVTMLKTAAAFVGNDSGLMHLAAALGVPTVGIFGSSNPDWTAPRGPWIATVAADGFPCRPCYRRRCNQAEFCLDRVGADEVLATTTALRDRAAAQEG